MNKFVCICLLLSFVFVSCSATPVENSKHIIDKVGKELSIGENYTLVVKSEHNGEIIDNGELLWSSSDISVANVSGQGVVTVYAPGFAIITARSKDNLEDYSTVKIFSEYKTIEPIQEQLFLLDENEDSFDIYSVVGVALERYGKVAVSALKDDMVSVVFDLVMDSLSKDVYWYSTTKLDSRVNDGIIYTISDWGNSSVEFDLNNIDVNNIYDNTVHAFSENVEVGIMMNEVVEKIKLSLESNVPDDGVYHLDMMNAAFEYRVVIRGDYTACLVREHYSNGALTKLGESINDIINWKLDELISNYAYTVLRGEIVDLTDIKICIEIREKQ